MSNPYPMLFRLDGRVAPGIPASLLPAVMRAVRSVERRTDFRAWFNVHTGTVMWLLGHDASRGGAHEEVVFQRGRYLPIDPDRTARMLNRTRMSWEAKKREVARRSAARQEAMRAEADRVAGSVADEYRSRTRYVLRKLMDGPRSRPSVLVP